LLLREIDSRSIFRKKNKEDIIKIIRQLKESGLSLREIAGKLNNELIPTKNNGIWHANRIRKILMKNETYKSI